MPLSMVLEAKNPWFHEEQSCDLETKFCDNGWYSWTGDNRCKRHACKKLTADLQKETCKECYTEEDMSDYEKWTGKQTFSEMWVENRNKIKPFILETHFDSKCRLQCEEEQGYHSNTQLG